MPEIFAGAIGALEPIFSGRAGRATGHAVRLVFAVVAQDCSGERL
jgi:hypothetical protein